MTIKVELLREQKTPFGLRSPNPFELGLIAVLVLSAIAAVVGGLGYLAHSVMPKAPYPGAGLIALKALGVAILAIGGLALSYLKGDAIAARFKGLNLPKVNLPKIKLPKLGKPDFGQLAQRYGWIAMVAVTIALALLGAYLGFGLTPLAILAWVGLKPILFALLLGLAVWKREAILDFLYSRPRLRLQPGHARYYTIAVASLLLIVFGGWWLLGLMMGGSSKDNGPAPAGGIQTASRPRAGRAGLPTLPTPSAKSPATAVKNGKQVATNGNSRGAKTTTPASPAASKSPALAVTTAPAPPPATTNPPATQPTAQPSHPTGGTTLVTQEFKRLLAPDRSLKRQAASLPLVVGSTTYDRTALTTLEQEVQDLATNLGKRTKLAVHTDQTIKVHNRFELEAYIAHLERAKAVFTALDHADVTTLTVGHTLKGWQLSQQSVDPQEPYMGSMRFSTTVRYRVPLSGATTPTTVASATINLGFNAQTPALI